MSPRTCNTATSLRLGPSVLPPGCDGPPPNISRHASTVAAERTIASEGVCGRRVCRPMGASSVATPCCHITTPSKERTFRAPRSNIMDIEE